MFFFLNEKILIESEPRTIENLPLEGIMATKKREQIFYDDNWG